MIMRKCIVTKVIKKMSALFMFLAILVGSVSLQNRFSNGYLPAAMAWASVPLSLFSHGFYSTIKSLIWMTFYILAGKSINGMETRWNDNAFEINCKIFVFYF